MDILLLAPVGMIVVMALLAVIGLPGKPRDRSPAPVPTPAAQPRPVGPRSMPPLPTPPPGYAIAFDASGRPILVSSGGR